LKSAILRRVVAVLLGGVVTLAAAQPAFAAVSIPAGQAGHACGDYADLASDIQFQACAWASTGSTPRIWFTGHFRNQMPINVLTKAQVKIGYYKAGTYHYCATETLLLFGGKVHATSDHCFITRQGGAYQAKIEVGSSTALSPTIVVN
jgi:hypothetical protein